MSKQAAQEFGRGEPSRFAELRAKKKERKEEKRKKVDANNVKRKEMGIRSAIYNPSRVFTTPTPTFQVGDKVTNTPITTGQKLFASREEWIIDSIDRRKAKCTSIHYPAMKKVWELEDLELKTASVGDANRDYTLKTLEKELVKRVLKRQESICMKKTTKLENTIQQLQRKVDALSKENDKMKIALESNRGREKELLNRVREKSNQSRGANKILKEFQDGFDEAYSNLKSQIKV